MFSAALIKDQILRSTPDGRGDLFTSRQYCTMFGLERQADFEGCESDYDMLARRIAAVGAEKPEIWMSCGEQDGLYQRNVAFAELLNSLGYNVCWNSWPGEHTWDFWDASFEQALPFLGLEHAEQGISSGNVQ